MLATLAILSAMLGLAALLVGLLFVLYGAVFLLVAILWRRPDQLRLAVRVLILGCALLFVGGASCAALIGPGPD